VIYITAVLEILLIPKINIFILKNGNKIELDYSIAGNFEERLFNPIPFATLKSQLHQLISKSNVDKALLNISANLLIMLPMPILINACNQKIKGIFPLLLTLILIIMLEGMQYFIGRSCDIDDIFLNMFGASAGYLLYTQIIKSKSLHCTNKYQSLK